MTGEVEHVSATALLFRDGVILLGAALLFVTLFRRFGLGAVLGYLTAGMLVGPHALGLVGDAESLMHIADLGIVLLLFLVGLELHPSRLWRLRQDIFGLGLLQVVISGLVIAAVIWLVTGSTIAAALALGLPLGLSSTAQVLPSLRSSGEINTPPGERAFSILLFQDLSIVPLLTIIAAMSRAPADPSEPPGWMLALYTVGAIAGLVAAGRYIINPMFRIIGRVSERELFVVAGLFTVLASAAVMEALHLSTALGAFVAGVMLADSPYRHELELDVEPFRSLLLGLFFIAVGMMVDLEAVAARPLFIVGMAAALVAVKAGVLFAVAKAFGMETRRALKLGLLLSQGGEFAFVLFAEAQGALLIAPEAASLFSAIVTLSMATTPFLMMLNDRLDRRWAAREAGRMQEPDEWPTASAIVIGYGRFGQTVGQMLMAKGVAVTLIDWKPSQIELSGTFSTKVYYGDGTRLDLLRQAGAGEAQALLFCIDDDQLDARKLAPIMEAFPHAAVFVRTFDRRQLIAIGDLNVAGAVREVFESAVLMGRQALAAIGLEEEEVSRVEREYRERDAERLARQSESGDLYASAQLMFAPERTLPDAEAKG
jgi:glutathione-regulated potassium-efflux system protein KefB